MQRRSFCRRALLLCRALWHGGGGACASAVQSQVEHSGDDRHGRGESRRTDLYREALYIVDSGDNAAKMRDVLEKMANLARKIVNRATIGTPKEEGYHARGLIRDQFVERNSGQRLVDMVLAKVKGEPFESEMVPTTFSRGAHAGAGASIFQRRS